MNPSTPLRTSGGTLIVRGTRVSTPKGEKITAIVIEDGVIKALIPPEQIPHGKTVLNAGDKLVMPALVDTHVHLNEPGRTEWEGFATGTRAAAAGGIGTVVEMPLNSIPVTTALAAFNAKRAAAGGQLAVDAGFWGGVVPGNAAELEPMIDAGILGFKTFLCHSGIDDFPNASEADLRAAMPILAKRGVPLLVHAELLSPLPPPINGRGSKEYASYLESRPKAWENSAIELMIRLCRETGCPVHIVHLSSADALGPLAAAKEEGLPITVETCPHYLFFSAEEVGAGCTEYKCAPPIREAANRERLWQGLEEGAIDFVVSDHSPCTPELKLPGEGDFMKAWGGISSLQFGLSAVWTKARERDLETEDVELWMCHKPARFAGLDKRKGKIAPGYDADLVIWDPDAEFKVEPAMIQHRHKLTPYAGRTLAGVIDKTLLRGRVVFDKGSFPAGLTGEALLKTNGKIHSAR